MAQEYGIPRAVVNHEPAQDRGESAKAAGAGAEIVRPGRSGREPTSLRSVGGVIDGGRRSTEKSGHVSLCLEDLAASFVPSNWGSTEASKECIKELSNNLPAALPLKLCSAETEDMIPREL